MGLEYVKLQVVDRAIEFVVLFFKKFSLGRIGLFWHPFLDVPVQPGIYFLLSGVVSKGDVLLLVLLFLFYPGDLVFLSLHLFVDLLGGFFLPVLFIF